MGKRSDGTLTVEMHNNLVRHTIESITQLTIADQRVICYLVAVGIEDPRTDEMPEFVTGSVSELAKVLDLDEGGKTYGAVKKATESLMRQIIRYKHPESGHPVSSTWLAEGVYNEGEGTFEVQFPRTLRKVLNLLDSHYTSMALETLLQIGGSNYAMRLYQILKSYESMSYKVFSITEIRGMLGVPKGTYARLDNFRAKVLNDPIATINERTDIEVEYYKHNKGRSWKEIAFKITPKKKPSTLKQAEKVPAWEIWWDEQCQTNEGQDAIWAAAYERGHVVSPKRLNTNLSRAHGLFGHCKDLWEESNQTKIPL